MQHNRGACILAPRPRAADRHTHTHTHTHTHIHTHARDAAPRRQRRVVHTRHTRRTQHQILLALPASVRCTWQCRVAAAAAAAQAVPATRDATHGTQRCVPLSKLGQSTRSAAGPHMMRKKGALPLARTMRCRPARMPHMRTALALRVHASAARGEHKSLAIDRSVSVCEHAHAHLATPTQKHV
jgi:hypothetical protein